MEPAEPALAEKQLTEKAGARLLRLLQGGEHLVHVERRRACASARSANSR